MNRSKCEAHEALLANDYCPVPGCEKGTQAARMQIGPMTVVRTLSRDGVYAWKALRGKGHCKPCAARHG